MQLVEETNLVSLYQGSCLDMGKVIPTASVALIVTSPPYPGVKQPTPDYITFDTPEDFNKSHDFLEGVWRACFETLEDLGRLAVNIDDVHVNTDQGVMTYPNVAATIKRSLQVGFILRERIIWHKSASVSTYHGSFPYPKGVLPAHTYEDILVFQKPLQFGQRRVDPSDYPEDVRDASLLGPQENAWLTDTVWKIPTSRNSEHPYTFPADIPHRLTRLYTYVGDTVMDPFAGSGTTLKAASAIGRKAIGFELSDKYIEVARKNLAQGSLF